MGESLKISIDAMGGDHAPQAILEGAALALKGNKSLRFILHGDEAQLNPLLEKYAALKAASTIRHTDRAITMEEAPVQALRNRGKESSMWKSLESTRDGEADITVSAGNTGALMGMTKLVLKTLPGIDRPCLAARWPNKKKSQTLVLDVGATVHPSSQQLVQFAIMGTAAASTLLGIDNPKVGILNVGVEDIKGTPEVKEAATLCQEHLPNNFCGFVEGDDILAGSVDVVVTDGFSGNIALKVAEGTARFLFGLIRESIGQGLVSKLGGLLLRPALRRVYNVVDPGNFNGAIFLGLEGLAVKSHGGADAKSFASAIEAASKLSGQNLTESIRSKLPVPNTAKAS